jgi:hypothetical protein
LNKQKTIPSSPNSFPHIESTLLKEKEPMKTSLVTNSEKKYPMINKSLPTPLSAEFLRSFPSVSVPQIILLKSKLNPSGETKFIGVMSK